MTSEQLAALAGVILSLLFSYAPGLSEWFGKLAPTEKRLIMAGLILLVGAGAFGLACAGLVTIIVCSTAGAWGMATTIFAALIGNQSTFLLSPTSRNK